MRGDRKLTLRAGHMPACWCACKGRTMEHGRIGTMARVLVLAALGAVASGEASAADRDSLRLLGVEPVRGELTGMRNPGDGWIVGENAVRVRFRYDLAPGRKARVVFSLVSPDTNRFSIVPMGALRELSGSGIGRDLVALRCVQGSPAVIRVTEVGFRLLELGPGNRVKRTLALGSKRVNLRFRCPARRSGSAGGASGMAGRPGAPRLGGLGPKDLKDAMGGRPGPLPGAKGGGRPDLVIKRFGLKRWGACEVHRPVMVFEVTLANRGTAPTPAIRDKALVQVMDQDGRGWGNGVIVPPIPAGGSRTVEVPVYYLKDDPAHMTGRAPHPFRAVADPLGLVAELNEGNNRSAVIQVDPRRVCQQPPAAERNVVLELVEVRVIKDGDPHQSSAPGEWTLRAGLRARSGARSARFYRQVNDGEVWRIGHRYPPLGVPRGAPLRVFVRIDENDGPAGITTVQAEKVLPAREWHRLLAAGRTFEVPFSGEPDYESPGGGPVKGVAVFRLRP